MIDTTNKIYPPASKEISEILGFESQDNISGEQVTSMRELPNPNTTPTDYTETTGYRVLKIAGTVLPILAVFVVLLVGYYFLFTPSKNNSPTAEQTLAQQVEAKRKALTDLQVADSALYKKWIYQFYFQVSDATAVDPNRVAVNGLTNFENYLLNLNPKVYSVLLTDQPDAEVILAGKNPLTGQLQTDAQKDIIAKYFDTTAIASRLPTLARQSARTDTGLVLPVTTNQSVNPRAGNLVSSQPINVNIPGRLEVPSLGINVPIIWSTSEANFDQDLKSGVVHYPGTPLPGQIGTSYISGHSSNYAWVRANFNQVFARMNELTTGTTFKVTVVDNTGADVRLHYEVTGQKEFLANDQAQFENTADSVVALSTCWPVNTVSRRLVTFGKLVSID